MKRKSRASSSQGFSSPNIAGEAVKNFDGKKVRARQSLLEGRKKSQTPSRPSLHYCPETEDIGYGSKIVPTSEIAGGRAVKNSCGKARARPSLLGGRNTKYTPSRSSLANCQEKEDLETSLKSEDEQLSLNTQTIESMHTIIEREEKRSRESYELVTSTRPSASTPDCYVELPVFDTIKKAFRKGCSSKSPIKDGEFLKPRSNAGSRKSSCRSSVSGSNTFSRSVIEDSLPVNDGSYLESEQFQKSKSSNSHNSVKVIEETLNSSVASSKKISNGKVAFPPSTLMLTTLKTPILASQVGEITSSQDQQNNMQDSKEESMKKTDLAIGGDANVTPEGKKTEKYPLRDVVAYVDVRSNNDNRFEGVARELERMGATVTKKFVPEITHVVFLNGRKSTLTFVEKNDVFFVSVLWVDSCMKSWQRVDEILFPASKNDSDSPMSYIQGKMKRLKSMQPKPFEEDLNHSGKLQERRKKRNIALDKKLELPFEILSLDDIEMKDINKKMQEHDSFVNSPIAPESPFLNQVMKKLSEKRECKLLDYGDRSEKKNDNETPSISDKNQTRISSVTAEITGKDNETKNNANTETQKKNSNLRLSKNICSVSFTPDSSPAKDVDVSKEEDDLERDEAKGMDSGKVNGVDKKREDDKKKRKKKLLSKNQVLMPNVDGNGQDGQMMNYDEANVNAVQEKPAEEKAKKKRKTKEKENDTSRKKQKQDITNGTKKRTDTVDKPEDLKSRNKQAGFDLNDDPDEPKPSKTKKATRTAKRRTTKKKVAKGSLVMTSLHFSEQKFIRNAVMKLGGFTISKNVNASTTHVIAGGNRRTLNILNAVAHGCWIVSPDWVNVSYNQGSWLPEEDFEMSKSFPVAKVARCTKQETGQSNLHLLFQDHTPFFVAEETVPPREEVSKLLRKCGGRVTSNAKKAEISVGFCSQLDDSILCVEERWLLDCIMKGEIIDTVGYHLEHMHTS